MTETVNIMVVVSISTCGMSYSNEIKLEVSDSTRDILGGTGTLQGELGMDCLNIRYLCYLCCMCDTAKCKKKMICFVVYGMFKVIST